jgi:hypothetical protein
MVLDALDGGLWHRLLSFLLSTPNERRDSFLSPAKRCLVWQEVALCPRTVSDKGARCGVSGFLNSITGCNLLGTLHGCTDYCAANHGGVSQWLK